MRKRVFLNTFGRGILVAGGVGLIALGVSGSQINNTSAANGSMHLSMTRSKMTDLKLSRVLRASEADGVNSVQSFAVTDKYFIAIHSNVTTEKLAYVRAYNIDTGKMVWSKKSTILGHGNGAT